ncbi:MAG: helix-turn-helix transcriptional regulator [Pseudomonadota bacterium]
MVRCHLSKIMGDRKVRVADVARGTGLNRSTITALYKETAELVDLEAIDKICEFLDCEVGELFTRDSA